MESSFFGSSELVLTLYKRTSPLHPLSTVFLCLSSSSTPSNFLPVLSHLLQRFDNVLLSQSFDTTFTLKSQTSPVRLAVSTTTSLKFA